jgi:hypothetical protein
MTMKSEGEHTHTDAWTRLESALADPELLDTLPSFADRVMARIAAVAGDELEPWSDLPEVLRRRGIPAAVIWPLWLSATGAAVAIRETWRAWAEAWRAIRECMSMGRAAPGENGAEGRP